jgi:hypothetical protein
MSVEHVYAYFVYACMCVFMYVCRHVCVYSCMCVCMYVVLWCMRVCVYASMHVEHTVKQMVRLIG